MEKTIKVQGMHCKSCEMLLNDSIAEIADVEKVNSDFKNGIVVVNYKTDEALLEVKKTIEKEGYKVVG